MPSHAPPKRELIERLGLKPELLKLCAGSLGRPRNQKANRATGSVARHRQASRHNLLAGWKGELLKSLGGSTVGKP